MDIKSKRFTFVDKTEYKVDLEYNEEFAILHLPRVKKLTKSVLIDMQETIDKIEMFLSDLGYISLWLGIPQSLPTNAKLAKRLKFVYRGTSQGHDVYERNTI